MVHFLHRIFGLNSIVSRCIFWLIILIIFLSSVYLASFIIIDKNKRVEQTKENLEYGINNQQTMIQNWANNRAEEIRLLANFSVSKELELDVMAQRFQYYDEYYNQLNAIVFIDAFGKVRIDTASEDMMINDSDVNLRDRAYFKAAEEGKEYMNDIIVSKASDKPTIIFSTPVQSADDTFLGVIFGAAHLSHVNDMLIQSLQGDSGEITLMNEEGYIISHLSKTKEQLKEEEDILAEKWNAEIFDKVKEEKSGFAEYKNHHGDYVYGTFLSINDGRYYLVNEISKREILQSHYQIVAIMIIITVAIIIGLSLLIIPVTKKLLHPIAQLVTATKRMEAGNYQTHLNPDTFVTRPLEIKQLIQGFNEMATSIYENKLLLKQDSNTDGLTNIANRRYFDEQLIKEWQYAKEMQYPISLIFVDIDFFKKFNDTFGHQQGDKCLIKVAQSLQYMIGQSDRFVARYGGEEFVMILPEYNSKEATKVAEAIRKEVKALKIQRTMDDLEKYVTVSIGVATIIPDQTKPKESLIQLADQALYEAKSLGRNRVVVKNDGC